MRNYRVLLALITLVIFSSGSLTGCGSSGDKGSDMFPSPIQTLPGSVIKGTVPGTTIHAIGDDGSYFKTETNPSDLPPRIFQIQVKPGIGYRLVLEEGNLLIPVIFQTKQGNDTARVYMSIVEGVLDLGSITISGGMATPSNNPLQDVDSDGDGIMDYYDSDFQILSNDPLDVDGDRIPNLFDLDFERDSSHFDFDGDGISDSQDFDKNNNGVQDNLELARVSTSDLLQEGMAQLASLNFIGAYGSFDELAKRENKHQEAYFGLALSRVGAVLSDLNPGTDPTKLETMKEVLDGFGFSQLGRNINSFTSRPPILKRQEEILPDIFITHDCYLFPNNAPRPNDLRAYLKEKVSPQIQAALSDLNKITPDINLDLFLAPLVIGKFSFSGEVDYSDILALQSVLEGTLVGLALLDAYNIEFDLDELFNGACEKIDSDKYQGIVIEDFLNQYPDLGKLENVSALKGLKGSAQKSINWAIASLDSMFQEVDDQEDDLITINLLTYLDDLSLLASIKNSFDGEVTFFSGTSDEIVLSSVPIFDGLNLRDFVPTFMQNYVVYSSIRNQSYDPSIGGILLSATVEDVVRFTDKRSPNVQFIHIIEPTVNPFSLQILADDIETLPDGSTQIGSGIDPASLSILFTCFSTPCGVTGENSAGDPKFVEYFGFSSHEISALFKVSGLDNNGNYTIEPNVPLEFKDSSTTSFFVTMGSTLSDRAGNSSFNGKEFSLIVPLQTLRYQIQVVSGPNFAGEEGSDPFTWVICGSRTGGAGEQDCSGFPDGNGDGQSDIIDESATFAFISGGLFGDGAVFDHAERFGLDGIFFTADDGVGIDGVKGTSDDTIVVCDGSDVHGYTDVSGTMFFGAGCLSDPGADLVYGTSDDGVIYYKEAVENGFRSGAREKRAFSFSFLDAREQLRQIIDQEIADSFIAICLNCNTFGEKDPFDPDGTLSYDQIFPQTPDIPIGFHPPSPSDSFEAVPAP